MVTEEAEDESAGLDLDVAADAVDGDVLEGVCNVAQFGEEVGQVQVEGLRSHGGFGVALV